MNLLLFSAGGTSFRLWKSSEIQIKCYLIFIWLCWCWSDERECERPRCLSLPDDFEGKLTRFSAGGTSFRRGKYWNAITTPRIGRNGRRLWTLGRAGGFIIFFKTKEIFTKFPIFLNEKKNCENLFGEFWWNFQFTSRLTWRRDVFLLVGIVLISFNGPTTPSLIRSLSFSARN